MAPHRFLRTLLVGAALALPALPAMAAAPCGGDFNGWLAAYKTEAASKGISQPTLNAALNGITVDQGVLTRDTRRPDGPA